MKVIDDARIAGTNIHVYIRNRMPSTKEFPGVESAQWETIQEKIESSFEWLPEHRFEWNELTHVDVPHNHYAIHLKAGISCYRSDGINKVQVIWDHDSDMKIVKELTQLVTAIEHKPKNRIGLIQMSYGRLNVKFVEYRPYVLEITPFLGEEIAALKQGMIQNFDNETKSGLYLIHAKPDRRLSLRFPGC